jgi:integrase/recombinase XerD
MTDEAMSPLRRRMIEDMRIRKLAAKTQQGYIRTIKNFAAFLRRSPDTATFEDVRRFQLHLADSGADTPTRNHPTSALRFFFRITLKQAAIIEHTQFIHEARKLPVVLSPEEVARLLNAAPGLKYKAALSASSFAASSSTSCPAASSASAATACSPMAPAPRTAQARHRTRLKLKSP